MTTPTAPTAPTDLRGHDLLRHVLGIIEREVERAPGPVTIAAGRWSQNEWAVIPPDTWDRAGVHPSELYAAAVDQPGDRTVVLVPRSVVTDCGTTLCFAGHVVAAVGDRFQATLYAEDSVGHRHDQTIRPRLVSPVEGGEPVTISDRARDLLGLTSDEADALFDATNTLADLQRIVDSVVDADQVR